MIHGPTEAGGLRPGVERVRVIGAAVGITVGTIVLVVGWWGGVDVARRVLPDLVSMKANTAAGVAALGVSILVSGSPRRDRVATFAAIVAAVIGAVTLLEYAAGRDLGIDQLLAHDPGDPHTPHPGRPGVNTATALAALGLAVVMSGRVRSFAAATVTQAIGSLGALLGFTGLVGYLLDVDEATGLASATQMALHTSVALVALGLAFGARASRDGLLSVINASTSGGRAARLSILSLAGTVVGLAVIADAVPSVLDTAELRLAAVVVATVAVLTPAVLVGARQLDRMQASETRHRSQVLALQDINHRLVQFTGVVAHDIRTPLSSALGLLELALEPDMDPTTARELIERALEANRRLDGIVGGLLEHARQADPEAERSPVSLDAAVAWLLELVVDRLDGAEINVDPGLPMVMGNDGAVRHVLQNLVTNALKYRTSDRDAVIDIDAVSQGGVVRLTVTDNGPGIAPELIERAFEPGERLGASVTSVPGHGLGLAGARAATEAMGGRLELGPRVDGRPGLVAVIELPAAHNDDTNVPS